jgi:hypothetical protein
MFPFNLEMQSFQKKLIALEKNFQTTYEFFIIKGDLTFQIVVKNVKY